MSAVTLARLSTKLWVGNNDFDHTPVRTVVSLQSFDQADQLAEGAIVVIDQRLSANPWSYRFDLALRNLPDRTAAFILPSSSWETPSLTAERIAAGRRIALGHLRGDEDAVSLAMYVQHLLGNAGQPGIDAIERITVQLAMFDTLDDLPELLTTCSEHLETEVALADRPVDGGLALRCAGLIRSYLTTDETDSPIVSSATALIARHIEDMYEADHEARALPDITRAELFNEMLLSDAATGADAVNRLRRSDVPIDGSHLAIRVDCHDPLPPGSSLQAVARCQARIAEIFLHTLGNRPGVWTQAGTANSILLISTLDREHSSGATAAFVEHLERAIGEASSKYPGLRLHVGLGTPHLGAGGLRASVSESATALRAARARGNHNQVGQFDRLGLGRALVRWAELDGVRPVINQILEPILDQPPRQKKEMLDTLRAYLDSGQNVAKTAEAMHLHRNTVRYRLDRIEALLTVDMADPDDRLLLELSCRVIDAELL